MTTSASPPGAIHSSLHPGHISQSLAWHWVLLFQFLAALSSKHSSQTPFSHSGGTKKTHGGNQQNEI